MVQALLDRGERAATLGPILHNARLVAHLEARGARVVESPAQTPPGAALVLRSHGVPREIEEEVRALGLRGRHLP